MKPEPTAQPRQPTTASTTGRKRLGLLAAALLLMLLPMAPAESASFIVEETTTLRLNGEAFWQGPDIDQATVPTAALRGIAGPCWECPLDVAKGPEGSRLRVALS